MGAPNQPEGRFGSGAGIELFVSCPGRTGLDSEAGGSDPPHAASFFIAPMAVNSTPVVLHPWIPAKKSDLALPNRYHPTHCHGAPSPLQSKIPSPSAGSRSTPARCCAARYTTIPCEPRTTFAFQTGLPSRCHRPSYPGSSRQRYRRQPFRSDWLRSTGSTIARRSSAHPRISLRRHRLRNRGFETR